MPDVILLVDDEANILSSLKRVLSREGYAVLTAESGEKGLEVLSREAVDLVISDMSMPNMDGATFLRQVKERSPITVRMLLTGRKDTKWAVEAIRSEEICRYVVKPWDDEDLKLSVRQALLIRAR